MAAICMSRGDLTEEGWLVIEPFLPAERGRWGRPAQDNRKYVNGSCGFCGQAHHGAIWVSGKPF